MPRTLRHPILAACSSLLVVLLASACATEDADAPVDTSAVSAPGPLLGAADSPDAADRSCQVVLRSVARIPNGTGGYVTDANGVWMWRAIVDVAADADGEASILYRSTTSPDGWWQKAGVITGDAPSGFVRWTVDLDAHLPAEGMSGTSLSRARIDLIPALEVGGHRLFDHNRLAGDLENYVLEASNQFAIGELPEVCPGAAESNTSELIDGAVIQFGATGGPTQEGPLVAGGQVTVRYDLQRLTRCRGTHNGYPAWNLDAHVRFLPGGQQAEATVRGFEAPTGTPTNVSFDVPAAFDVPADATAMELWFSNTSYATGTPCEAWDSNDSRNYSFDVLSAPGWMGNPVVKISRAGGHACEGGTALGSELRYDTWARTRSVMGNVCFEVWQPGVTDRDNADLWRQLAVEVHYRFEDGPWHSQYVDFSDRTGNNARYVLSVAALDPFRFGQCPERPTTVDADGESTQMEFVFTVNGVELRAPDAAPFRALYLDYPDNGWRAANCPTLP